MSLATRISYHNGLRMPISDLLGRPLKSLRVSVTDRCNLRCQYCMPEGDYSWLPRQDILHFEEIGALVDLLAEIGVERLRLTGGEPLLRQGLASLVRILAAKPRLQDISLTTNGVLLAEQAQTLREAGLQRVTVSLDTLKSERFRTLARSNALAHVLEGISVASRQGLGLKLNVVVMRNVNDDELSSLLEYGTRLGAEVRFIEYMDVGGATRWSTDALVPRVEILRALTRHYGAIIPKETEGVAPADRFMLPDGTVFGIVASVTTPFCRSCDRSRLTSDGLWYRCLYARDGIDLRGPLRAQASETELRFVIEEAWRARADRGAETRQEGRGRTSSFPIALLKRDPHLEMHTRGG